MKIKYFSILCIILFTGCFPAEYIDISLTNRASGLIGKEYKFKEDMLIHGVTMKKDYGSDIDIYVISVKPGISGKEILYKSVIEKKCKIIILKAYECKSCIFSDIRYEVKLIGFNGQLNKPIFLTDYGGVYVSEEINGILRINSSLFDVIY